MILDATKRAEQRALLEAELEAVGIRLNLEPPLVLQIEHTILDHRLKIAATSILSRRKLAA